MTRRILTALSILLLIVSATRAEDTVESLEKKLNEAAAKVKSMSCKQREITDMDNGDGTSNHREASTSIELRRDGGKVQWRSEEKSVQVDRPSKDGRKWEFDSIEFDDGDRSWSVLTYKGKATYYKMTMRANKEIMADKSFFDHLKADNDLKVLPEITIDEKKCAVIESLPKQFKGKYGPGEYATQYFIQLETGLIVKKVCNHKKAKPMTTMTRSDIKLNPAIGPERFTPPAGATIADM